MIFLYEQNFHNLLVCMKFKAAGRNCKNSLSEPKQFKIVRSFILIQFSKVTRIRNQEPGDIQTLNIWMLSQSNNAWAETAKDTIISKTIKSHISNFTNPPCERTFQGTEVRSYKTVNINNGTETRSDIVWLSVRASAINKWKPREVEAIFLWLCLNDIIKMLLKSCSRELFPGRMVALVTVFSQVIWNGRFSDMVCSLSLCSWISPLTIVGHWLSTGCLFCLKLKW